MDRRDIILILLNIQLSVMTFFWVRAEKRASYAEGQLAVMTSFQEAVNDAIGYPQSKPK